MDDATDLSSRAKGWSLAAYAMLTAILSLIGTALSIGFQVSDYFEKQPRIEFIENAIVVDNEPLDLFISNTDSGSRLSFTLEPVRHRLRVYNPSSNPIVITGVWISGSFLGGYAPPRRVGADGRLIPEQRSNLRLEPRTAIDLDMYYAMTFKTDNEECLKPRMRYPDIVDCRNLDGTPMTRFKLHHEELIGAVSVNGAPYAEILARLDTADGQFFAVPLDYTEFQIVDANPSR